MDALVVGAGDMGRWFGAVLRDLDDQVSLTMLDRNEATASAAAETLECEYLTGEPDRQFDLVCIAVPIPVATEAIETYSSVASEAMVDVTGTMEGPVAAMAENAPDLERASLHPLFAPANEPGNVAFVSPDVGAVGTGGQAGADSTAGPGSTGDPDSTSGPGGSGDSHVDALVATLEGRGNTVFETTPEEHDDAMRTVQARAHTAVLAYALAADDVPDRFQTPVSETLAALVDQVTAGESHVYADIQAAFEGSADVAEAAAQIAAADRAQFTELFAAAGRDRDED